MAALPRRMVGYMTAELAEMLTALTTSQRAAIDKIVQHVYVENRPMRDLLHGPNKVAAENSYYRRPKFDDDGVLVKKGGWHHDPIFQVALKEAARLALLARTREEMEAVAESKRRARLATPTVVDTLIDISRDGERDGDRVTAANSILKYAEIDEKAQQATTETTEAEDWWGAAGE